MIFLLYASLFLLWINSEKCGKVPTGLDWHLKVFLLTSEHCGKVTCCDTVELCAGLWTQQLERATRSSMLFFCCYMLQISGAQPVDSWTGVSAQELPSLWLLYLKCCPFREHKQLVVQWLLKCYFILLYLKGVRNCSHEPVKCSKQSWKQQYQNPISHCSTFVVAIDCLDAIQWPGILWMFYIPHSYESGHTASFTITEGMCLRFLFVQLRLYCNSS